MEIQSKKLNETLKLRLNELSDTHQVKFDLNKRVYIGGGIAGHGWLECVCKETSKNGQSVIVKVVGAFHELGGNIVLGMITDFVGETLQPIPIQYFFQQIPRLIETDK